MAAFVFGGRPCVIVVRAGLRAAAVLALLSLGAAAANAAGALAVGACAAYGYAYDYPSSETAQAAAIEKCGDVAARRWSTTAEGLRRLRGRWPQALRPARLCQCAALGAAQNTALQVLLQVRRQGLRDPRLDLRRQEGLTPASPLEARSAYSRFSDSYVGGNAGRRALARGLFRT